MWQEILVGICVLAASYFVLRQWLPIGGKKSSGCGSCGTGSSSCTSTGSSATNKSCAPSEQPK